MVPIVERPMPISKYSLKCPYLMTPTRIVIHNTANDASAQNEVTYMQGNSKEGGFHYAVDDKEIIHCSPLNRNTWNATDGNGKGNREGIAIEICYSKSGGERFEKAQENAAELTAKILKEKGWGIDKVTKHYDYYKGKICPHRTLQQYGWDFFLNLVKKYMGEAPKPTPKPEPAPVPKPTNKKVDVTYRVKTQKHGWLPAVKNLSDYAGWQASPITQIEVTVSDGTIRGRVHTSSWSGYSTAKKITLGNGTSKIDAVELYYNTPDNIRPYKKAKYRVASGKSYYPWQYDNEKTKGQDGYAGAIGKPIIRLQISIE